jgi:MFS transporter, DHA2 family, multidrug resistance protein
MSAAETAFPRAAEWRPAVNPWVIAVTVTLATFMEVLDTSIANVALPHISGGLGASQDESTWVLTSYLVSNAIVLPLSGWISSIVGRKRYYMFCVALFTVSSFLCGLAPNLTILILFRILQGIGGGGLQPSEQSILADTFPPAKRGMAFAIYGMAVVFAPAIGPTLGGWITDNYSWRWIFYINVPVGIVSLLLTSRLISDPPFLVRKKLSEVRIDYIGLGLLGVGLGALQVVLDKGERDDWFDSHFILVLTVISAVALISVIFWEWKQEHPIINLKLFRDRSFATGCFLLFMLGVILYGTTVLLPLFMQTLLGYTARQAGLALMPGGFVIIICMPFVGYLLSKFNARWLLVFGLAVTGFALLYMSTFDLGIDFKTAALGRVFQGVGLAFLFIPINTAAYANLPREKNNEASGLINLARNIGGSVGISFVATMLDRRQQFHQSRLVANITASSTQLQTMLHGTAQSLIARGDSPYMAAQQAMGLVNAMIQRQASMLSYIDNFYVLGITSLVLIPTAFLLKKSPPGGEVHVH